MAESFQMQAPPVATLSVEERTEFLGKVYGHLAGAIGAFIVFEVILFTSGIAKVLGETLTGTTWLLVLGGFMVVQFLATTASHDLMNPSKQYLGLLGMAAAQALIFAPFLYYVFEVQDSATTVWTAAAVTGMGFAGLTVVAFVTRSDLGWMRPLLMWAGVAALVAIVAAILFGFELGTWFSVAMIAVAGGSILYQTQTIIRQYPSQAYVGAAVALFASVMLLFWYVLRLFMARD
jgi:FtsH-binding integral membrane protein